MADYAARFHGLGTAVLADAAFRVGADVQVPDAGLNPLELRSKLAGPAVTVEANGDLVAILEAVHRSQAGDVVVIGNSVGGAALIGDLIGTEAVRRGLAGFLVDGPIRDAVALIDIGLTVVCRGTYPVGPLKVGDAAARAGSVGVGLQIGGADVGPGAWVFGDADGVVVLEPALLEAVFAAADVAEEQEATLAGQIAAGLPLGDAIRLEEFLALRASDGSADFNAHIAGIDRAI